MINDIIEETSPMNIKLNNIKESSVLNNSPSITKKKHIIDFKLIEENAFKVFKGHLNDIIDISWGGNNSRIILSASLDKTVILWDLNTECFIHKFNHINMVTCVEFCPNNDDLFISGCLDKIVRIWDIKKKKVLDFINVQDLITSLSYFSYGNKVAVGFHNGKVILYDVLPKLKYHLSIDCKNRYGKYANGRKVTGLEFINNNELLISTNDSRIRLFNIKENKMKQKFKGLSNDEIMIKAYYNENNNFVISASDDSLVYIWKRDDNLSDKVIKNDSYYSFKPFESSSPTSSLFLNEVYFQSYQKKLIMANIYIRNIIISVSRNGMLQVLVNPIYLENI